MAKEVNPNIIARYDVIELLKLAAHVTKNLPLGIILKASIGNKDLNLMSDVQLKTYISNFIERYCEENKE